MYVYPIIQSYMHIIKFVLYTTSILFFEVIQWHIKLPWTYQIQLYNNYYPIKEKILKHL